LRRKEQNDAKMKTMIISSIFKNEKKTTKAAEVPHVVGLLPSKHEALSSADKCCQRNSEMKTMDAA
jgi:hypothetical protein